MTEPASFDITAFIGTNPIMKLTDTYNNRLLDKIKNNFNQTEQQLFISSFYCYLNYHPTNDFVIDLDNVWKWLGFSQKVKAKQLLEKQFIIERDYKKSLYQQGSPHHGGQNKDIFMLNVKTFKLFCIKANTSKANEIHEYFVKLEELLFETIQEECADFKKQLETEKTNKETREIEYKLEQMTLREQSIVNQFPANTQCVYYGRIDNTNKNGNKLVKFGCSHHLQDRIKTHKRTFTNFYLVNAFKVNDCNHVESAMKNHPELSKIRHTIKVGNTSFTELFEINEDSYEKLNNIIINIIKEIQYSPENYTSLLNKNVKLEKTINYLRKKLQRYKYTENNDEPEIEEDPPEPENEIIETEVPVKMYSRVRLNNKSRDGKYHIDGNVYNVLYGSRQDVWDGIAYQTQGTLKKDDLMLSTSRKYKGKIISKMKRNQELSSPDFRFNRKKNKTEPTDA